MKKVVVAEASPTIKSVADSLLRQNGFDVVCTSDGLQAWEVISAEKPDLVLIGQGLSGISGLELCHQIATDRLTGGVPVVLMIGAKDPITEEQIVASGARGKLRKPFSPKDLLDVADRLAGQSGASLKAPEPVENEPHQATKFNTQVSSTQHLHQKKEPYNLGWLDLNEGNSTKHIPKVASYDLNTDEHGLVIDNDQYGLAHPPLMPKEEETAPQRQAMPQKDEDYEWFLGEIKREIDGKSKIHIEPKPSTPSKTISPLKQEPQGIKFDDIASAEEPHRPANNAKHHDTPPLFGLDSSTKFKTLTAVKQENSSMATKFSADEIEVLADRIAYKLATHLASLLDKAQIARIIRDIIK